jgi:hypothetical protein
MNSPALLEELGNVHVVWLVHTRSEVGVLAVDSNWVLKSHVVSSSQTRLACEPGATLIYSLA